MFAYKNNNRSSDAHLCAISMIKSYTGALCISTNTSLSERITANFTKDFKIMLLRNEPMEKALFINELLDTFKLSITDKNRSLMFDSFSDISYLISNFEINVLSMMNKAVYTELSNDFINMMLNKNTFCTGSISPKREAIFLSSFLKIQNLTKIEIDSKKLHAFTEHVIDGEIRLISIGASDPIIPINLISRILLSNQELFEKIDENKKIKLINESILLIIDLHVNGIINNLNLDDISNNINSIDKRIYNLIKKEHILKLNKFNLNASLKLQ